MAPRLPRGLTFEGIPLRGVGEGADVRTEMGSAELDRAAPPWRVLADGRGSKDPAAAPDLRRTVVAVVCASTLALLCLLAVTAYAARQAAESEALRGVRASTQLLANAVLAPALDEAVLRGDPAALRRLDALVRERVLIDPVVRIKVWTAEGRVLYSDMPGVIGADYPLDSEKLTALLEGTTTSGLADLGAAEHHVDGLHDQVLEVYTPIRAQGGQPLLVEAYSRYSLVTDQQAEILRTFLPITVAALLVLQLCQLPLAWSMVKRLRAGQREREHLLQQAVQASDDERRRIAGDLHDTVVQGLVGTSYVLAAAGERLGRGDATDVPADLRSSAGSVRESVRGLRSLLLEIYPAHVERAGLSAALEDLVALLRLQGIDARTHIAATQEMRRDHEALVFRTAQEVLRNVARHSGAHTASVGLELAGDWVALVVEDDGAGFDVAAVLQRGDGPVGLRVLSELAVQAGCVLSVSSAPGRGTRVRLEVPRS